ncbi:VOC family protein [Arthrobacter luteolus]|uniref:VOC family protein n=1 Tax=Arthrobacter luteolus TaxID=98672 RepID=UPI00083392AB|nr:VOC family protein [Arthrobacter luteolus]
MERMIFPNLPVSDLAASTNFYLGLGFEKNDLFSDERATAVVISDAIVVMLLEKSFFQSFLADGDAVHTDASSKAVINGISCGSRAEVDALLAKVEPGGGAIYSPARDMMPGMYSGSCTDPDGHIWEFMWMDPASAQ